MASVNADCYGKVLRNGWQAMANARTVQAQGVGHLARPLPRS